MCVFPKKIFSEKRLKLILKRIKLKWQIKRIDTGESRSHAIERYDSLAERLYFFSLLTSRDILRIIMLVFMSVI